MAFVVALGTGVFFARFQKSQTVIQLASLTNDFAEAATVNRIAGDATDAGQSVTLPGETAAWDETTIYARVDGLSPHGSSISAMM